MNRSVSRIAPERVRSADVIELLQDGSKKGYQDFLERNRASNYCHDSAWKEIIREGYGMDAFTLLWVDPGTGNIEGAAPACYLTSPLFGRNLVCLPYLDYGGILAVDPEIQARLRTELASRASARKAKLEIRSLEPLADLAQSGNTKVAMLLPLKAEGPDAYWKSLDAKVRNQVRKAEKSGVTVTWGRQDRLEDFYRVFCVNMRDLGSPTHSRRFFESVLKHMPGAQIGTAHREGKCIGGLFRILWRDTLAIPWASTLKEERVHCPNNALYWESIRFAFEQKCGQVDFGRSSKEEGTYKFKKQWLALEKPLHWYQFDEKGGVRTEVRHASTGKLGWVRGVWSRLPLPLANALGPMIRGGIPA
jgi:FemAB-related protein (PEP-CTERM system-associated)